MCDNSLLRYVPARLLPWLEDCYHDSDGYWYHFTDHVIDQATGSHTVHENTIRECLVSFRYARLVFSSGGNNA